MINLGIYIPSVGDKELLNHCLAEVRRGKNNELINDASIFYDNAGPIDFPVECGLFNAVDLWYFSGKLLVLSTECAIKALNIVNNIDMYLGYGWGKRDILSTLNIISKHNIKTICRSQDILNDFYRVTGKSGIGYSDNLQGVIELMTK
jgi:hypothetical protein